MDGPGTPFDRRKIMPPLQNAPLSEDGLALTMEEDPLP
jgi:hypothetical protein